MTTTWILIAFGVFIVALTIVSILGIVPAVRIVPDDTKFDFCLLYTSDAADE